jgi:hypothetical protein
MDKHSLLYLALTGSIIFAYLAVVKTYLLRNGSRRSERYHFYFSWRGKQHLYLIQPPRVIGRWIQRPTWKRYWKRYCGIEPVTTTANKARYVCRECRREIDGRPSRKATDHAIQAGLAKIQDDGGVWFPNEDAWAFWHICDDCLNRLAH